MVSRMGVSGARWRLPAGLPSLPRKLRWSGGSAWWAGLAPLVANYSLAMGSAAALRSTAVALGGLAQHGVGRVPTLSAQEACHKRAALEQSNLLHVHVHGIWFACFSDPAMHAPYGG